MQPDRMLRCYVFGREQRWQAICTDLDISVEGASAREALETLGESVRFYVVDAMQEDAENRERLLNRRSPWIVTFGLLAATAFTAVRERLNKSSNGQHYSGTFSTLCLN